MNKFDITLTNFQSHTKSSLSFSTGLTAITGASNSGKSSILRALTSLCLNPIGAKKDIKKGSKDYIVDISFNDSFNVLYNRFNDKSTYQVNNQSFAAMGRDNIYKVLPDNFPLVKDETGDVLNIQGEWSLMFPFSRKESDLFKLFEDIFCIQDSNTVIKQFNSIDKENKAILKTANLSLTQVDQDIESIRTSLSGVSIPDLLILADKLKIKNKQLTDLKTHRHNINVLSNTINQPVIAKLNYFKSYNTLLKIKGVLDGKITSPEINNIVMDIEKYKSYFRGLEKLKKIRLLSKFIDRAGSLTKQDTDLSVKFLSLDTKLKDIHNTQSSVTCIDKELEQISMELEEVKKYLASVKTCPVCNQTIYNLIGV